MRLERGRPMLPTEGLAQSSAQTRRASQRSFPTLPAAFAALLLAFLKHVDDDEQ